MHGPAALFASWALHDVEEVLTFPATADHLAEVTGIEALRMNTKQSVVAVGLVGAVVAWAGARGARTAGDSRLYRYAVAGLEGHVFTHLLSSLLLRGYTAGVITAVPIMWPGAAAARRELAALGKPLADAEWRNGGGLMTGVALAAQIAVRIDWFARLRSRRTSRRSRSRARGSSAGGGAG
ncbi:HXXEE domain-containing protein [Brevibacterium renqingii]|uniref:HXXEE domain-containing protein n=1 Tax=Brevibacterium renqingii TaxID=2776916 RepID=UPI003457C257